MTQARWIRGLLTAVLVVVARPAQSQDVAAIIAEGERERASLDNPGALAVFERGLVSAPSSYELLWRASREAADLGESTASAAQRTTLYTRGEQYARRAVTANPAGADGHAMLAIALGRTALSVGVRERVRFAKDVRAECLAALKADPDHAAALHVLGVWHAEIMRLSGIARFTARTFLGGAVFSEASWGEAQRLLERAVAVDPQRITHRLDLARIYVDTKQPAKARATCQAVARMPVFEYHDARYQRECAALLATLGD
ncbi:MAG: tetratricopeptide repeat protein [Gemmatimonadaceae bacterium]|nr:tetratricopeptide repeat protein [Gemmatimonadaceae bacterium]